MDRHLYLLVTPLIALLAVAGCNDEPRSFQGDNIPDDCDVLGGDLATGLDITGVAIYQGVRISLLEDGGNDTGIDVPLVAGKDAVMRVHVTRQSDYSTKDVYVRVEFSGGDGICPVEQLHTVSADSSITTLSSTLNVEVPGEYIQPGVEYAVSIREADGGGGGNSDNARWPSSGTNAFDPQDAGGPLKIVIVPVKYNADGSGRLPELGDDQLQLYEDLFYNTYPVPDVEIEVLEPYDWSTAVSAYGQNWDTLLNAITQLRNNNGAADNEYYYGSFAPAGSIGEFCGGGCVAGLCNLVEQPSMSWGRACIGLGFPGIDAAETMIHEVGHAHGRWHSPSGGAQQVDPSYPYPDGTIGVHGYSLFEGVLYNPSSTYDFMGYSMQTNWVSDYTYEGLFQRVVAVNSLMDVMLPDDFNEWWPTIAVGTDGSVSKGPDLRLDRFPAGRESRVSFLGPDGVPLDEVQGYFMPYDHLPGGLVLYPEPEADVRAVQLDGFEPLEI